MSEAFPFSHTKPHPADQRTEKQRLEDINRLLTRPRRRDISLPVLLTIGTAVGALVGYLVARA